MSVQMETYVMAGVMLPYKGFRSDRLESFLDEKDNTKNGLAVIMDGMGGKYIAVGKVLGKANGYEGFEKPIEVNQQPWEEDQIRLQILELIGQRAMDYLPAKGVAVLAFTHYR